MPVFVSYSSQDRTALDEVLAVLRRSKQQVWFDQELGGGESWWRKIVDQIRACDLFVVALSNNWLQSKPCQAELRFAQALSRPILPVRIGPVDSVRLNPLAALQIIDYQKPTVDASIQLVTAVHTLKAQPQPLPDPMPEDPPVPYAYLMRLGDALTEKEISPQEQLQILVELKSGLDQDGDDPTARSDIAQLLRMLRMRHDVTFRTRPEIDNVLAAITPNPILPAPSPPATASEPRPHTADGRRTEGSALVKLGRRPIVLGGAAAVAALIVATAIATQNDTGPASVTSAPHSGAPPAAAAQRSYLLSPAEVGAAFRDASMAADAPEVQHLRATPMRLSNPNCQGAFEPIADAVYQGAVGLTGVQGQAIKTPGENPPHWAYQAVATFSSPDQAHAFVESSAAKWKACADTNVTLTTPTRVSAWTFGPLQGSPPKIWMERALNDTAHICHHVLNAVSHVVVDVVGCADDVKSPAGKIADQIAAKVTD